MTGHDVNRRTKTFPYVGQNVASRWSSSNKAVREYAKMLQDWYAEVYFLTLSFVDLQS